MMKRTKRYLVTMAAFAIAASTVEAATWACWSEEGDFLSADTMRTVGDTLPTCWFTHMTRGTGITFNKDGTGFVLLGYTTGNRRPFSYERQTRLRWTLNPENNLFTIRSETENGHISIDRWYVVEMLSKDEDNVNVWLLQHYVYPKHRVSMWRIGSPEDIALREWRDCMHNNKGKGFDAVDCGNPLEDQA